MELIIAENLQNITKDNKIVVVMFSSPTCIPCKILHRSIEQKVEHQVDLVKFVEINAESESNRDFILKNQVLSAPTLMIYLDGTRQNFKGKSPDGEMVEEDRLTEIPRQFENILIKIIQSLN